MEAKQPGCHSRFKARLRRPRAHDDKCLAENMDYIPSQAQKSRSDSADACILESSRSDTGDGPDVPPLRRADGVLLTKEYLQQVSRTSDGSEASISCVESSDDEYIPSEDSADEGSSEVPGPSKVPLLTMKTNKRKTKPRTSVDEEEKGTKNEISGDTAKDNISVMKLKKKLNGARVYSKTHYCLYCPVNCHKMSRHLIQKHSREPAVAKAISFPLKSKERKMHFDLIRNQGNRVHNNEVLNNGSGTLVPGQQSAKPVKTSDYMHCINCEAFLKRKTLQRHMSTCRLLQQCGTTKPGKNRIQSPFAQPVPDGVTQNVLELVNAMHRDEVTSIVRKEISILKLAEHLYAKHGHDKTKHEYIRQKMREVGRLIQESQKRGLQCLKDFYVPSNFNLVMDAVKAVAGFDEEKNMFKSPSLALKLRLSLKKLADILECEALMAESGNEEFLNNLNTTRGLFEKNWDVSVSSGALHTLRERKWNTPQLLPLTEDVKIMHRHLDALVAHRGACGVSDNNPYFFARSKATTHLRGSDAIRQMAKECGAKHPEALSSPKLRKQVSTLSTVLSLKDGEMDTLGNFLGFDIRDREYYRRPEGTVKLAEVSKMLIASEQGRSSDFTGMSLDETEVDPNDQVLEAVDSELSETERETPFCPSGGLEDCDGPDSVELTTKGSSGSKKRRQPEFDSDDQQGGFSDTENQPPESDDDSQIEASKKRSGTQCEVDTVENTLKSLRDCGKVPMKSDCCLYQGFTRRSQKSKLDSCEVLRLELCHCCSA